MITAAIILFVGLLLIYLEFHLPGGVMGTAGAIVFVSSIIYYAFYSESGTELTIFIFVAAVLLVGVFRLALWRIKSSGKKSTFYLESDQEGYVASAFAKEAIGKKGVVLTDLKPAGHVLVDKKHYQAVARAGYIAKGANIIVVGGEGGHLIVKLDQP